MPRKNKDEIAFFKLKTNKNVTYLLINNYYNPQFICTSALSIHLTGLKFRFMNLTQIPDLICQFEIQIQFVDLDFKYKSIWNIRL